MTNLCCNQNIKYRFANLLGISSTMPEFPIRKAKWVLKLSPLVVQLSGWPNGAVAGVTLYQVSLHRPQN